jgi:hypothetical protein
MEIQLFVENKKRQIVGKHKERKKKQTHKWKTENTIKLIVNPFFGLLLQAIFTTLLLSSIHSMTFFLNNKYNYYNVYLLYRKWSRIIML